MNTSTVNVNIRHGTPYPWNSNPVVLFGTIIAIDCGVILKVRPLVLDTSRTKGEIYKGFLKEYERHRRRTARNTTRFPAGSSKIPTA